PTSPCSTVAPLRPAASHSQVMSLRAANGMTTRHARKGRAPWKTMRQLKHTLEPDGGLSPALFGLSQPHTSARPPAPALARTRVPGLELDGQFGNGLVRAGAEPIRLADRFQCD